MNNKILSGVVGLLLITSTVGFALTISGPMSPVQNSEAWGSDNPCQPFDRFLYGLSLTQFNKEKCGYQAAKDHIGEIESDLRNATSADKAEWRTDKYESGLAVESTGGQSITAVNNTIYKTDITARQAGQMKMYREMENGSSLSLTKNEINNSIEDTYAQNEIALAENWNAHVLHFDYMHNRSMQEGTISGSGWSDSGGMNDIGYGPTKPISQLDWYQGKYDSAEKGSTTSWVDPYYDGFTKVNITLTNGTKYQVLGIKMFSRNVNTGTNETFTIVPTTGKVSTAGSGNYNPVDHFGIIMNNDTGFNSNYSPNYVYMDWREYNNKITENRNQEQKVKDNMAVIADNVYANYSNGDINVTEMLENNPQLLAEQYSSDYNSTGYWAYAVGTLASQGMSYPDMVKYSNVTIEKSDGTRITGMPLIENSAIDQLKVGKTYNPDNIGSSVVMVNQETGNFDKITKNFTIISAYDKEGNATSTVGYTEHTYDQSNTTQFQEEINGLKDLSAEIESLESVNGGGGGSTSTGESFGSVLSNKYFGFPVWAYLAASIVVAGVFRQKQQ